MGVLGIPTALWNLFEPLLIGLMVLCVVALVAMLLFSKK
jgi:hypothetical protein